MGITSDLWSHLLWGRTGQRTFLNNCYLVNLCEREVSVKFPWSGYYQILPSCFDRWVRFMSFGGLLLHDNSVLYFLQFFLSLGSPRLGLPKEACSLGFVHGCISFVPTPCSFWDFDLPCFSCSNDSRGSALWLWVKVKLYGNLLPVPRVVSQGRQVVLEENPLWSDILPQSPGVIWISTLALSETQCGVFGSFKTFFSPNCNISCFVSASRKLLEATGRSMVNSGEPNPHPSWTNCRLMTNDKCQLQLSLMFWIGLNHPCALQHT